MDNLGVCRFCARKPPPDALPALWCGRPPERMAHVSMRSPRMGTHYCARRRYRSFPQRPAPDSRFQCRVLCFLQQYGKGELNSRLVVFEKFLDRYFPTRSSGRTNRKRQSGHGRHRWFYLISRRFDSSFLKLTSCSARESLCEFRWDHQHRS